MDNSTDELLIQYIGATPSVDILRPGIEIELISAEPGSSAGLFDYTSTLSVSAASVLGGFDAVICAGGSAATEVEQNVELRCESE